MMYFCTYFDSNYLLRGIALYKSLARQSKSFRIWVLCLDDLTYEILRTLRLPQVHPIPLGEFESGDKPLLRAKGNRSQVEYYFTCTPSLILYVLKNHPDVELITYIDADLFFFSSPAPIFSELGKSSILIVGHRFPPRRHDWEVYGIYNVGFLSFRRDESGLRCLRWWRRRCLEWCYDRVEKERFADQKYLDDWPIRFRRVVVLRHKGAGLGPWNVTNYHLSTSDDHLWVESDPLIFFHFQGLKMVRTWLYDLGLATYGVHGDSTIKLNIYGQYIRELREVTREVSRATGLSNIGVSSIRRRKNLVVSNPVSKAARNVRAIIMKLLRGQDLLVVGSVLG